MGHRSRAARLGAVVVTIVLGLTPSAPATAQEELPIFFLSDQHSETVCDQPFLDIYVLEAGDARRITNALQQTPDATAFCNLGYRRPVVSPDGSMIAAVRLEGSSSTAVVMNADGSEQRVVGHPGEFHVTGVSWSPDGTQIVHDGHDLPGLKIVALDGSSAALIPGTERYSDPAWSPDGSEIAFAFIPGVELGSLGPSPVLGTGIVAGGRLAQEDNIRGRPALGAIAPDGSGFRQITLDPDTAAAARPAWSPDGTEIAFETQNPGCGGWRVSIVPAGGAREYETLSLPAEMCRAGGPSWLSPTRLAFWGATGVEEPDLYAADRGAEAALARLTITPGAESDTSVASDGTPPAVASPTPTLADAPSTPTASRVPIVAGAGGALVALVVAGLFLVRRAARRRLPDDRAVGHTICLERWEPTMVATTTARDRAGTSMADVTSDVSQGFRDLIDALERARRAFEPLDPSPPTAGADDAEIATVQRVLDGIAEGLGGDR